jgi:dnd system-associated protein 4
MNENKAPDRLNIRKSDRGDYARLLEKDSPFVGKENKDLFMMAMMIGFREGSRSPLDKKEGFVRIEYLNEKEKSIIKAIVVAEEGDLSVLANKGKVYSIAEEYAAGGIKLLKNKVFSGGYGSFIKKLESELVEEFEKIKTKNSQKTG